MGIFRSIMRRIKRPPPSIVEMVIEFHHVKEPGDLWVDWTNELGAGRKVVWRVLGFGDALRAKTGGLQYQLFTPVIFERTSLAPNETRYQHEPSWPYNILRISR